MGGEQADDENYCRARNDRRGAVEPPDDNAGDRAGYRRAGVDVLYEYVRLLPGENIAQHSAADAGYDPDEYYQKRAAPGRDAVSGLYSDDREHSEPERVENEQNEVVDMLITREQSADCRQKSYYRRDRRDYRIYRVTECAGRRYAENEIARDSAADSRHDAQNHDAENIHVFLQPRHRARNGKRNSADNFKSKNENVHKPLRKQKEYTIRKMVYSVFLPERFSASRIASSVQMPFQRTVPVRFFYLRVSPLRWPEIRLSPKPVNRIPDYFIAHSGTCQ